VRQQATVRSIGDVFYVMTIVFLLMILVTPIMKRPQMRGGGAGGH
jgi:hypothetical protein